MLPPNFNWKLQKTASQQIMSIGTISWIHSWYSQHQFSKLYHVLGLCQFKLSLECVCVWTDNFFVQLKCVSILNGESRKLELCHRCKIIIVLNDNKLNKKIMSTAIL